MTNYICPHGRTLYEACPDCELETARAFVEHWGDAVDAARKVIADGSIAQPLQPVANVLLKVGGRPFRCECKCNVFHHPEGKPSVYACNACELQYEGE